MDKPIQAGVIVKTRFVDKGFAGSGKQAETFKGYIDYIDRDAAVRTENFTKYNLSSAYSYYSDYMGNPEKSSGLFTANEDSLSDEQKKALKGAYQAAYDKDGIMWQTVISFDNRFLMQLGIYDPDTGVLDEAVLQQATRRMMREALARENMTHTAVWSAAIHYNTDNIHVHIAFTEPTSTRPTKLVDGQPQAKGYFSAKTFRSMKSKVVNSLLENEYTKVDSFIREQFVGGLKNTVSREEKNMSDLWFRIYDNLPTDKRQWFYNMNEMKPLRPLLDELTHKYLQAHHKEDFADFQRLILRQQHLYQVAYGQNSRYDQYAKNKMQDLYARMGNAVLAEMRQYSKSPYSTVHQNNRGAPQTTAFITRRLNSALKKAFNDEYQHNEWQHKKLEQEIQFNGGYE